jgi:uncharacterized protein (TIGR04168 family)
MSHLPSVVKIAVVGDVHDLWDDDDAIALQHLNIDLLLLVGDFGNESVALVRQIAQVDIPKAVILGNHDAWYSATEWGRKKSPYDHAVEDRITAQLDALGEAHVGYNHRDFSEWQLSVVGARPFSWGGSQWFNADFYRDLYGISTLQESTQQIVKTAQLSPFQTLILVGHCGPSGLGSEPEDPCGKDWHPAGGDHGDQDFADAIAQIKLLGKHIPLVVFGHMHHNLRHTHHVKRTPLVVHQDTVYLNAACVPRIIETDSGRFRNFSLVTLTTGQVTHVSLTWINDQGQVLSDQTLY